MVTNYSATNIKTAKNFTQSTEITLPQAIRNNVDFLPAINQTESITRFFKATVDQLLSSGSTESINSNWGRLTGRSYNAESELFQPEADATRLNYQFAPGVVYRDKTGVQSTVSYINSLRRFENLGSDLTNHDKLFSDIGYTLDLPINIDMFTNHSNYYWLEGDIPIIEIDATLASPINIDDILVRSAYTTPVLTNGQTLKFVNGIRIKFIGTHISSTSGLYAANAIYYVEGVGSNNIRLVEQYDATGKLTFPTISPYAASYPSGWDLLQWDTANWDYRGYISSGNATVVNKSYFVMDRGCLDKNPWARSNRWFSIYALTAMAAYNKISLDPYLNRITKAKRPIIEFKRDMELYNSGKNLIDQPTYYVTGLNSNLIVGKVTYALTDNNNNYYLLNGDTILFINDASGRSDGIYTVGGVGANITLTAHILPAALADNDKVIISKGHDIGNEYHWLNSTWIKSQQKATRGTEPLFELYEDNVSNYPAFYGITTSNGNFVVNRAGGFPVADNHIIEHFGPALKKISSVIDTDFAGERIFGYATSTMASYDAELDIHPTFANTASMSDFKFDYTLNNIRYSKNLANGGSKEEIKGMYNYLDYVRNDYLNCWNLIRGDQRVPIIQTQTSKDAASPIVFDLGTNAVNHSTEYSVTLENGNYRFSEHSYIDLHEVGSVNPTLVFKRNTNYTINNLIWDPLNSIQFVDPHGNADVNIHSTIVGNVITLNIATAYQYEKIRYKSIGPNIDFGEIMLSENNQARYSIKHNGKLLQPNIDYTVAIGTTTVLSTTVAHVKNDVFELSYIADATLTNAVYDVAPIQFYNATNEPYYGGSFSSLLSHFNNQLGAMPGFVGHLAGENNYHETIRLHNASGLIRQQVFETPKLNYLLNDERINPIKSLKVTASDFTAFKSFFKNKVQQLWTTNSFTNVSGLVDRALTEINTGKNKTFKYAFSDMAYYKQGKTQTHSIVDNTVLFNLPATANQYGNTRNHVHVWLKEYNATTLKYYTRQLTIGVDYAIAGNQITLTSSVNLSINPVVPAILTIRMFDYKQPSYIPFSAAKLGFVKPTQVEILGDTLIGHDGSRHIAANVEFFDMDSGDFDVVTAALYEFELRVFNNMVADHAAGFGMSEMYPTVHKNHGYTVNDLNVRLDDWYNRYAVENNIQPISTPQYIIADKFTWNYSSVGPKLGGWRAIYQYYFGTDRPHTHPWEMLGFQTKPNWWDAQYSWALGAKRTALVTALSTGLISDPSLNPATNNVITDVKYARNKYDWGSNILVTVAGFLNDPITANVVTSPTVIEATKPFVFGDWGDVENVWRTTSEYKFALAEVYLQLKPYRTHELFWSVGRWRINNSIAQSQWIDVSTNTRSPTNELHKQLIGNGIVSNAEVISGGTGYTTNASITFPNSNICIENATADIRITAGVITSVEITNPGRGYVAIPSNSVLTANLGSGAQIRYTVDFDYYPTHLGFSALAADSATLQEIDSSKLATILRGINVECMLHIGGFTDKRILKLELDGSYENGKIGIPTSNFDIMLDKNAPLKTVYFSGVRIDKVAAGFKVSGYNMDSKYFVYTPVSAGGKQFVKSISGTTITQYMNFMNETVRIPYNTIFSKRQSLYDFLRGLANYYVGIGFPISDNWNIDADKAMAWSLDASVNASQYYLNGITNSLRYEHGNHGISQEVDVSYNGTVNILNSKLSEIRKTDLYVLRDATGTEYSLKDGTNQIFGIGINTIEYEHIITLKNITDFNDVVFDLPGGIAQKRINVIGERTRNWAGKIEAPGYLVRQNGIMLNMESGVREVENDWIDLETKALDRLTRQTLGYNVGYTKPTYMKNTFVGDLSAARYNKGYRKYQGTDYAIDAMTSNKNIFGSTFTHKLNEEWMIRLGDYGDISEREPLQFVINQDLIKSDSQLFRFSPNYVTDLNSDMVIDLYQNGPYSVSGDFAAPFDTYPLLQLNNTSIATANMYQNFNRDAGLPLTSEIDYFVKNIDNINDAFDPTAPYATINNWNDAISYVKGETIRHLGKVYQLNINSTGLTTSFNKIVVRGTQIYPQVNSGDVLILDGASVTFANTITATAFAAIDILGSVVAPVIPSGTTLAIDGINVNFIKTSTSTTSYNNIVADGTALNPTIVNSATATVTIDGIAIPFNQAYTTETLEQIYADAFTISGFGGTPVVIAAARITAFENLRVAFVAALGAAAWQTWIGNYYVDAANVQYQSVGVNPEYLGAQIAANATAAWEPQARALLANDLDLMNRVAGNLPETVQNVISNTFVNQIQYTADITATKTILGGDPNIADAGTFMKTNGSISLTSTLTITVATPTPVRYVTNSLIEIQNKINTAAILGVTASINGSILRLTSTNAQLTISASSSNTSIGFPAASTVYNATSTTTTVGQTLTLAEAIVAINNAAVPGITAADVLNQLQLQSTNASLTFGVSSGLTEFGFTAGVINAVETITTTPSIVEIYDIVDQINAAKITNVTAGIVDGILVVTSTGTSLIIGAGTANIALGFTDATTTATDSFVKNTFNPTEWVQIPELANFNIWVINDIGSNIQKLQKTTNFYNVYQTVDNQLGVLEICAGNMSGDDAEITCNAEHGLNVDDFVMIVNSTCIPNIDGIHRVTKLTGKTIFFINKYIKSKGYTGTAIPIRTMRFSDTNAANAAINTLAYASSTYGLPVGAYVYVDVVLGPYNNSLGHGGVYIVTKEANTVSLKLLRIEESKTDNSKIVNGILYNYNTNKQIEKYEVFDPLKGILPGIADKEIDIKHETDFAAYNNSTDANATLDLELVWSKSHIGTTWWDLSNAIYLNYDQGSDEYKQENWGKLFPTSTIDIYEWTKSPVTPDEYANAIGSIIDGIELTGNPYSFIDVYGDVQYYWTEDIELNNNTNQFDTYYYFWVKNKTTVPTVDRIYSVFQLSEIIKNPSLHHVPWIAATGKNTLLVNGLLQISGYDNMVMQVNINKYDNEYHQEFVLLGENDPATTIPEWLHISLRDSLAGFMQLTKTTDYTTYNVASAYVYGDVVQGTDSNFYICHINATGVNPVTDTLNNNWRPLILKTINPDGNVSIPESNNVEYITSSHIPSYKLHPYVTYGIGTRPHQTWFMDLTKARKVAVDKINDQLLHINLIDSNIDWRAEFDRTYTIGTKSYDLTKFWVYIDWNLDPLNKYAEAQADYFVDTISDLKSLAPTANQVAHVNFSTDADNINRHTLWKYTNGAWSLIFKEKGTIAFNDLLWDIKLAESGWDLSLYDSTEWDGDAGGHIFEIFNSFYNVIYTNDKVGLYADLWFHLMKHVMHEQPNVDWAFKSSYVNMVFADSLEKDYNKYFKQNINELFDYVNKVKPFRTKLRDATIEKTATDNANVNMNSVVEFRVQTNPTNAIVNTTTTRSFQIAVNNDGIHNATQIVNTSRTLLGLDVTSTSTVLPMIYSGNLAPAPGVVWINGEQISYAGVLGQLLTGCVRGVGNTLPKSHIALSTVEDGTGPLDLAMQPTISNYGNTITPAFNIAGKSLLDITNTNTTAVTIRGIGKFGEIDISNMTTFYNGLITAAGVAYTSNNITVVQTALSQSLAAYMATL